MQKKTSILVAFAALFLFNGVAAFAQTVPAAAPTITPMPAPSLETILSEAQKQTDNYRETFRNLLADEMKTFEEFDKNGSSEGQTTVKSNFLVYQSGKNTKVTTELRNVLEVNGKPVGDSQQRGDAFLAEIEKEKTLEKELRKIQSEGSRFDKTLEANGLTLYQAVALAPNLRPFFDFKMIGTENYLGNEVYVVSFQQTKKSPYSTINGKETVTPELSLSFKVDYPSALKKNDIYLRGKFWIDAKNFQIWREERELTIQTAAEPIVLLANVFEYQASDYGILVPKNILLNIFTIKKEKGGDRYVSAKDATAKFDYSRFRQANVEVRVLDDDTN